MGTKINMLFLFRWSNAIGYVEAPNFTEALTKARYVWERPYHTRKIDGFAVWYSTVDEAIVTKVDNLVNLRK